MGTGLNVGMQKESKKNIADLVGNDGNMGYSGINWIQSQVMLAHITDGTSKTYMVGEKYLNPDNYFTGDDPDDEPYFNGTDIDLHGCTAYPPMRGPAWS